MRTLLGVAFTSLLLATSAMAKSSSPTEDEIAQRIIADSIARYPSVCACPYSKARNGSNCGRRSAYSKPGGYAPICYREDVSDEDIARYRRRGNG
ncbi:hypothetical protein [Pseudomonas putida]